MSILDRYHPCVVHTRHLWPKGFKIVGTAVDTTLLDGTPARFEFASDLLREIYEYAIEADSSLDQMYEQCAAVPAADLAKERQYVLSTDGVGGAKISYASLDLHELQIFRYSAVWNPFDLSQTEMELEDRVDRLNEEQSGGALLKALRKEMLRLIADGIENPFLFAEEITDAERDKRDYILDYIARI